MGRKNVIFFSLAIVLILFLGSCELPECPPKLETSEYALAEYATIGGSLGAGSGAYCTTSSWMTVETPDYSYNRVVFSGGVASYLAHWQALPFADWAFGGATVLREGNLHIQGQLYELDFVAPLVQVIFLTGAGNDAIFAEMEGTLEGNENELAGQLVAELINIFYEQTSKGRKVIYSTTPFMQKTTRDIDEAGVVRVNNVLGVVNTQMLSYIAIQDSPLLDSFDLNGFMEAKKLEGEDYFVDHIHFNDKGYEAWAKELEQRFFPNEVVSGCRLK